MDNPVFVDEETIPMVHQDEDYDDDYNTANTSRRHHLQDLILQKQHQPYN